MLSLDDDGLERLIAITAPLHPDARAAFLHALGQLWLWTPAPARSIDHVLAELQREFIHTGA